MSRVRFGVLGLVALSLFAALFTRLWYLQVTSAPVYKLAADNTSLRIVAQQAPRGRILDRKGRVLVGNRRSVVVSIDWQAFDRLEEAEAGAMLERLATELNREQSRRPNQVVDLAAEQLSGSSRRVVTSESLRERLADPRFNHFKPVPVAEDVGEELEIYLTEHVERFPAVRVERVSVREYRYGKLLAHVLGYVGAINENELTELQNEQKPYENDDDVGKTGIERALEHQLRGVPGQTRYEVDARNRPVEMMGRTTPIPGNDVRLTIDIDLQALTEQSLQAQILYTRAHPDRNGRRPAPAGSSVVLDPSNGQVLAMASYPTFDPSTFVNGISSVQYQALNAEGSYFPLTNRALQGQYAAGSTFKLVSAYAALKNGIFAPDELISDPGSFTIPGCRGSSQCTRSNAGGEAHGRVDLPESLTVSSDVYYYKTGYELWSRRNRLGDTALQDAALEFGFGERTGGILPDEAPGRIPTPAWQLEQAAANYAGDEAKIADYGTWRAGHSLNVAIGQGDVLVTPLQLANAYAAFANGGTLYVPQYVLAVTTPDGDEVSGFEPEVIREIELPGRWRGPMLEGFAGVPIRGTAGSTFSGFPSDEFPLGGKTGTAQVDGKVDTSLFVGFGPITESRYTAAAIVEQAGFGSSTAAPIVRRVLEPVANGAVPPAPDGGRISPELAAAQSPEAGGID